MSKKNQKNIAAENLIESLMDDLHDMRSEEAPSDFGSYDSNSIVVSEVPDAIVHDEQRWVDLGKNIEGDIGLSEDSSEYEVPMGFEGIGDLADLPSSEEEGSYQGPSADGGYQSSDEIDFPVVPVRASVQAEDKTVSIQQDLNTFSVAASGTDVDKTVAVDGFANARLGPRRTDVDVKVSIGNFRGGRGAANVMTSVDASLAQSENLKIAQHRILELETEVEKLRAENEELASAGDIISTRADSLGIRISAMEREKQENQESAQSEILILKGNLQYKENEAAKARMKVEELETRLKSDFKKIRVRERELENRLELLRAEKSALVRSKDEYILEQKRKIDQLSQELDNYRKKCLELNKTIEVNQDQVKRTERALRLALSNLEAKEENFVPLKKAE